MEKVVEFGKRRTRAVSQDDLDEFLALTKELRDVEQRWRKKSEFIADSLRSGAAVEPGMHEAFLSKLVVR